MLALLTPHRQWARLRRTSLLLLRADVSGVRCGGPSLLHAHGKTRDTGRKAVATSLPLARRPLPSACCGSIIQLFRDEKQQLHNFGCPSLVPSSYGAKPWRHRTMRQSTSTRLMVSTKSRIFVQSSISRFLSSQFTNQGRGNSSNLFGLLLDQ